MLLGLLTQALAKQQSRLGQRHMSVDRSKQILWSLWKICSVLETAGLDDRHDAKEGLDNHANLSGSPEDVIYDDVGHEILIVPCAPESATASPSPKNSEAAVVPATQELLDPLANMTPTEISKAKHVLK